MTAVLETIVRNEAKICCSIDLLTDQWFCFYEAGPPELIGFGDTVDEAICDLEGGSKKPKALIVPLIKKVGFL